MLRDKDGGTKPQDIQTVESMLAKMRAGRSEVHEIMLGTLVVPVRVLTIDEMNQIRREAIKSAQSVLGGDDTDKNLAAQKFTLKLASTPGIGGVPMLSDKLLAQLSVDEVNYLYEEYVRVLDAVNPSLQAIDPERFRALVDALKKKTVSSRDLSLLQLRAICTAFVELILRLDSQASAKDR